MQFRCWSCGLKFSDGPPPLEALSPTQASLVGVDYRGDPGLILCDALSHMSVYNFCSVCILTTHLDRVWQDDLEHLFMGAPRAETRLGPRGNPDCSCGFVYPVPEAYAMDSTWYWIWVNRQTRIHRALSYDPTLNFDDVDLSRAF